jgi:hypothetical protein
LWQTGLLYKPEAVFLPSLPPLPLSSPYPHLAYRWCVCLYASKPMWVSVPHRLFLFQSIFVPISPYLIWSFVPNNYCSNQLLFQTNASLTDNSCSTQSLAYCCAAYHTSPRKCCQSHHQLTSALTLCHKSPHKLIMHHTASPLPSHASSHATDTGPWPLSCPKQTPSHTIITYHHHRSSVMPQAHVSFKYFSLSSHASSHTMKKGPNLNLAPRICLHIPSSHIIHHHHITSSHTMDTGPDLNLAKVYVSVKYFCAVFFPTQIATDIAKGLCYIHAKNIVHGDLRCASFLLWQSYITHLDLCVCVLTPSCMMK